MKRASWWLALTVSTLSLVGCSAGSPDGAAPSDDDSAAVELSHPFAYANPDLPYTATQVRVLEAALDRLAAVAKDSESPLRRQLAKETLARIEAGDVRLGSVGSARGIDRYHMCKDFKMAACQGPAPAADDRTWLGDEALGKKLENELDGYQWGNRIYFTITRDTDPNDLAKTLAHEVNHVLNRSECDYYANLAEHEMDGNRAFLQEFRSYLAECYYVKDTSADVDACTAYASKKLEMYGFQHDLAKIVPQGKAAKESSITRLVVGAKAGDDAPLGRLLPEASVWPHAFGACPKTKP